METNRYEVDQDVDVYRQDGSKWFEGVITFVSKSNDRLLILDNEGEEIAVNPTKNKVEIIL